MDMQGEPIGSTNQGMKNTTDPRSSDAIREGAGGVASDSLAAESYRAGGGFAENRGAEPSGASGDSVTWNTTDTSNARRIDPDGGSSNSSTGDNTSGSKFPEQMGGKAEFPGGHNADGYSGGPSRFAEGAAARAGGSGGGDDYTSTSTSSAAGTAPSYTLPQTGAYVDGKPKGSNLTEGGFSGEGRSYASGIGTRDDPGRAALKDFEQSGARADPGSITQTGGIDNDQPYEALKRDESA